MQESNYITSQLPAIVLPRDVQAGIPAEKERRNRLLRIIRDYVNEAKPVAPLSPAELKSHAETVLAKAQLSDDHHKYISVLLNNEVWRETMGGIPFNRRLLLLPQCLRDQDNCRGQIDAFGLICNHCGCCPIHDIQTEAERLGYAVMVAEGSPVVMAMIESRQIEAVVGVSCLEVLEKVFPYMDAAAIPGIAIPLLQNGCSNTSLDLDWLWDALHLIHDKNTNRVDTDMISRKVQWWFEPEQLQAISGITADETERIGQDWLAKSGKRWRPLLTACVYQAIKGPDDEQWPRHLREIALAVECFHKASLVHDDIEDHDMERYQQQTLHEQYGVEIALNVGDYLLGEGYRLIAEADISPDRKVRMLQTAAQGHRTLCIGQGAELSWRYRPRVLSSREVLNIFRQKTAPAFQVALHMGAICAGTDEKTCRILSRYSEALGIAYQIFDDLSDFAAGTVTDDLAAQRPTLLPALAWEHSRGEDKILLQHYWENLQTHSPEDILRVRQIIEKTRVPEKARALLEYYKNQAICSLSGLRNSRLKGLLRRVLGKIFNDLESLVCCHEYKKLYAEDSPPRNELTG